MRLKDKKNRDLNAKLIALNNPKSSIVEAYRALRTNIHYANVDNQLKSIMVTSTKPNEGKTTTISNLAIVLAQQGKKVILIDSDLRKPAIHHIFKLPGRIGLTNVLVGAVNLESAIQQSGIDNLSILTSGPIPPNPVEMLGSKRMEQIVSELLNSFDYVLIDAPPLLVVTDAQILSRLIDGVLLVVSSGKTQKDMALNAKKLLENVHAHVIGVVLNNKEIRGENYYYY